MKYKNTTTSTEFGEISTYEYSLPAGWRLSGGSLSTGPNDWKTGTNNVTIVPNLLNAGLVYIRSANDCGTSFNKSLSEVIGISRPSLTLVQNGANTIQMRCGETEAKTFTVQNAPPSPSCITYTWKVANKGWSTSLGGPVQTTDIISTSPSLTLYSADNNSNPPQSVTVEMSAANSTTVNSTVPVQYLQPSVSLHLVFPQPFACNEQQIQATLNNVPLTSYSFLWDTRSTDLINGNPPPQANIGNSVTVTRLTTGADPTVTTATIQASCGNILSANSITLLDCSQWQDFAVHGYMPPDYCNGELRANVEGLTGAIEYEWYAYYHGNYHLLTTTYLPELLTNFCACADQIELVVRAKTFESKTNFQLVGTFGMSGCFNSAESSDVVAFPNPASTRLTISYKNAKSYTIKLVNKDGVLFRELKTKGSEETIDVSKIPQGKYFVVIKNGDKTISKQIEIKR